MKAKRLNFKEDMLGKSVSVVAKDQAKSRGFTPGKLYKGALMDKKDWLVGCPVFVCDKGMLGLEYECYLVEEL